MSENPPDTLENAPVAQEQPEVTEPEAKPEPVVEDKPAVKEKKKASKPKSKKASKPKTKAISKPKASSKPKVRKGKPGPPSRLANAKRKRDATNHKGSQEGVMSRLSKPNPRKITVPKSKVNKGPRLSAGGTKKARVGKKDIAEKKPEPDRSLEDTSLMSIKFKPDKETPPSAIKSKPNTSSKIIDREPKGGRKKDGGISEKTSPNQRKAKRRKKNFAHVKSRLYAPTKANIIYKENMKKKREALMARIAERKAKKAALAQGKSSKPADEKNGEGKKTPPVGSGLQKASMGNRPFLKKRNGLPEKATSKPGIKKREAPGSGKKKRWNHVRSSIDTGRAKPWKPKRSPVANSKTQPASKAGDKKSKAAKKLDVKPQSKSKANVEGNQEDEKQEEEPVANAEGDAPDTTEPLNKDEENEAEGDAEQVETTSIPEEPKQAKSSLEDELVGTGPAEEAASAVTENAEEVTA